MKLEDLLEITSDTVNVTIYDKEDKNLARYDGRDSIPAILNGARVDEFTVEDNELHIKLDFLNNAGAIDYLKDRLDDITENIATDDDYYFDVPETVNAFIANQLDNIVADIRDIQRNLNSNLDWNCGMYI